MYTVCVHGRYLAFFRFFFFFCNIRVRKFKKCGLHRDLLQVTVLHHTVSSQTETLKWPQISFCKYSQRGSGKKMGCREMIQEQDEDCRKRNKRFFCDSLNSKHSSSSTTTLQSALFLFLALFLDCGFRCFFCWHTNAAHNRGSTRMCLSVASQVFYVLLFTAVYAMLIITVCCCLFLVLFYFFAGLENEPNSMH